MTENEASIEKGALEEYFRAISERYNELELPRQMTHRGFGDMPASFSDSFLVEESRRHLALAQICIERAIDEAASPNTP